MNKKTGCDYRFVALPVGQGDSFYIYAEELKILVDGGRAHKRLGQVLRRATGQSELDIVICTHNDSDHANGLLGLLKAGYPCEEVWLPGSWTVRLIDLLDRPLEFIDELIGNINGMNDDDGSTLGKVTEDLESRFELSSPTDVSLQNVIASIDTAADSRSRLSRWPVLDWRAWISPFGNNVMKSRLFQESLAAASRIEQLAEAAFTNSAIIRWFEFTPFRGGQPCPLIKSVNCEEIATIPSRRLSALQYLSLSVANRESLVFQISSKGKPSILLTADSDLKSGQIDWTGNMLITAPHHGSESNAHAYSLARDNKKSCPGDVIWIRSDGLYKQRPGTTYLRQSHRFCTRCRGWLRQVQTLDFDADGDRWQSNSLRLCDCLPQ